jgi:fido (protein-threonine AMPylation protein)
MSWVGRDRKLTGMYLARGDPGYQTKTPNKGRSYIHEAVDRVIVLSWILHPFLEGVNNFSVS